MEQVLKAGGINMMYMYRTSKDYTHLKELLDSGQRVVCFVEWVGPSKGVYTDMCYACLENPDSPEYRHYAFKVRGFGYGDYWPQIHKDHMDEKYENFTFEEYCESLKLEYIEPDGDN